MDDATDGGVRNEPVLLKIAALLVTLSLVAERAAGHSWPVRFLLLLILRRAESVATAFVFRETEAAGASADDFPWLDEIAEDGSSPLHAAWFALRFRALAAVLELCRAAWRTNDTVCDWTGNRADDWVRSDNISGIIPSISGGIWRADAPRLPVLLIVRLPGRRFHRLPRPPDTS
ncbi:hypothetical protein GPROT1_02041 [Gammaproteobacteria bacterium]|nr:hypothetical protein GPROT1_02041 [Gammaproteobacteria bacterium]